MTLTVFRGATLFLPIFSRSKQDSNDVRDAFPLPAQPPLFLCLPPLHDTNDYPRTSSLGHHLKISISTAFPTSKAPLRLRRNLYFNSRSRFLPLRSSTQNLPNANPLHSLPQNPRTRSASFRTLHHRPRYSTQRVYLPTITLSPGPPPFPISKIPRGSHIRSHQLRIPDPARPTHTSAIPPLPARHRSGGR